MINPSLNFEDRYWPFDNYRQNYKHSMEDPEAFWAAEAAKLTWFKSWDKVLKWNPPYARWFVGGLLNASYL
ncbi:MAG: acetyl-coenzyme A synthetase N-terminal domain-containing protein, partial [Dehalococcoidia bacterium]|nr:acetyl-coenzyme A synthetase N-terminal domain-containing protein [Dehalococcoidia bacterium]